MKKIERLVIYPLVGILLILAMIFDLKITQGLYNPDNLFGRLFEAGAEVPCYLFGVFALCLLSRMRPQTESKGWDFVMMFGFLALAGGLALYGGRHTAKLLNRAFDANLPLTTGMVFLGLIIFAVGYALSKLISLKYRHEAFTFAIFALVALGASVLLMQGLKMVWLRPRYRTLVALQEAGAISSASDYWLPLFRPQFFTSFKKYGVGGEYGFTQEQIAQAMKILHISEWSKEEFYSFPSGHTMNFLSCCSISFLLACLPLEKMPKWTPLAVRICFYVLGMLVAISRIVRGAHNATDVLVGYALSLAILDLGETYFHQKFLRPKLLPKLEAIEE